LTQVYRLVRRDRAADVLSGEGARVYGGRWNPRGLGVVYASQSRALAVLETFVHVTLESRTMQFVLFTIALPSAARIQRYRSARPPRSSTASQEAGRKWLDEGKALALAVPSVIVPQEANYVLNARHVQFAELRVTSREPFSFDGRLWKP
jgi:RES domain-containing protein